MLRILIHPRFIFKIGQAKDFLEPLLEAKKAGLKLALHLAEVSAVTEWRGQATLKAELFVSNEK